MPGSNARRRLIGVEPTSGPPTIATTATPANQGSVRQSFRPSGDRLTLAVLRRRGAPVPPRSARTRRAD
jgi:hypothetical protein